MRTTLTLEDDVAARLERLLSREGGTLKETVNELLRRGLDDLDRPRAPRAPYRTPPHDAGRCFLPDLDSLHGALAYGEGEGFK